MEFKFEVQVRDITSKARLKVLEILVGLLQDPNPEKLPNQHPFRTTTDDCIFERGSKSGWSLIVMIKQIPRP
jgi:hypothetical protein